MLLMGALRKNKSSIKVMKNILTLMLMSALMSKALFSTSLESTIVARLHGHIVAQTMYHQNLEEGHNHEGKRAGHEHDEGAHDSSEGHSHKHKHGPFEHNHPHTYCMAKVSGEPFSDSYIDFMLKSFLAREISKFFTNEQLNPETIAAKLIRPPIAL